MKKETKQKNKFRQVMSKMKKPLMIFSIILNIIFALALVIGLSSEPKAQSVKAENSQLNDLTGTSWTFPKPSLITGFSPTIYKTFTDIDLTYSCESGGQNYSITGERLNIWQTIDGSNNVFNFKVYDGWVSNANPGTTLELYYQSANYQRITYHVSGSSTNIYLGDVESVVIFNSGEDLTDTDLISFMYQHASLNGGDEPPSPDEPTETENKVIYLGDNFNPVSYVTQGGEYILNGFAGKHIGQSSGYLTLTGLTFNSNNTTFNTIKIAYGNISAIAPIVTQDGSTYMDLSTGYNDYLCCFGVFYQYTEQDNSISKSVQVISYRRTIIDDNGVIINAYDVRQPYIIWLNNEYRTLNIISDDESIQSSPYLTINGMTTKQLLQVTSSVNTNVMGLTDVFGLLKGAFSGISGILAISILPGITLGLLLFIPLIVTIIIAVVRLIKK